MIQPRSPDGCTSCFNICVITYLHPKKMDLTLTAIVMSQVSSGVSCSLAVFDWDSMDIPALLTSLASERQQGHENTTIRTSSHTSMRPYVSTAFSTKVCQSSALLTSTRTYMALPPFRLISSSVGTVASEAISCLAVGLRSAQTSEAPCCE